MNRYSSSRDTTADQKSPGVGMHLLRMPALCRHKCSTTGAKMRGNMVLLCPACWAKEKALDRK